jgi:spore coat polysaccharide biosynthesis protein SpsF
VKTVAIVQARMGSTRLPGKVLADIHGKPLLGRLLDRLYETKLLDEVVVATTLNKEDDPLVEWLIFNNVKLFRGSETDVLNRYYQCATRFGADLIVRVTADDPLKDSSIIEKSIRLCLDSQDIDYASNTLQPTYPEGLDIEVFRMSALIRANTEAELPSEREHVTPYIWSHPEKFVLRSFSMVPNLSHWRWTVDNPADLEFMRHIFGHFIKNPNIGYREIITYIEQNSELMKINSGIARNEGYLKSLTKERSI